MSKRSKPSKHLGRRVNAKTPGSSQGAVPITEFEAELLSGLKPLVHSELVAVAGIRLLPGTEPDALRFRFQGPLKNLQCLRTVVAVYATETFLLPRPKALLGHEHLQKLLALIKQVLYYDPKQKFRSFRFSAAGRDSTVFQRLAEEISKSTGLVFDPEEGELLLRLRPLAKGEGWEILLRLTPRPLSARAWRVCNMPGGLNATIAVAMLELADIRPQDRFLNAMCGSGTLLVERRLFGQAQRLVGCDLNPQALSCSKANLQAGGFANEIELYQADATNLDFAAESFDVIVADLPWGDAVGNHKANASMYPVFLTEMARLAAPQARLLVLTHEIRLFEKILAQQSQWRVKETIKVFHGGHYPHIYSLKRNMP